MIKASELRIGNMITYGAHGVVIVNEIKASGKIRVTHTEQSSIDLGYMNSLLREVNLDPILLTPEWLHKFGVTWNNINGSEYYFTTTGLDGLRLDPPTKGEDDGWTPMTPDGDGSIGKEIFFVHQLQNLYYSLTGEELTIKEPA